jgi:hypothetical protein
MRPEDLEVTQMFAMASYIVRYRSSWSAPRDRLANGILLGGVAYGYEIPYWERFRLAAAYALLAPPRRPP